MTAKRSSFTQVLRHLSFLITILCLLSGPGALGQATTVQSNTPVFFPAVTYGSGGSGEAGDFRSVAVADLNGDNKPDIAVANFWTNSVGVLLNNGDGTFQPAVSYTLGSDNPTAIAIADLNGDRKPDLAVGNWAHGVSLLLGNGDGTFQPAVTYASGGVQTSDVVVVDVNRDRKPDLIVANYGSAVGVLLGNGDGTFQPAVTYGVGSYPFGLAVADVNADGKLDLLAADGLSGTVAIALGNSNGSFQSAVSYQAGSAWAQFVAVVDVNGDKKPDLEVAVCGGTNTCQGSAVAVLLGNGDGTFQTATTYNTLGLGANGLTVADVNGDAKPDVVTADWMSNDASVLLGDGTGAFQSAGTYASGGFYPMAVVAADVNGDTRPDLIVRNECADPSCNSGNVAVLLNNTPFDLTSPTITVSANPRLLRPPNGTMVPVVVSGRITDTGSGVKIGSAAYAVQDQYHLIQSQGKISPDTRGNYSFTIMLRASLESGESNPHNYTIRVSATDNVGNRAVNWARVTVPRTR